MCWSGPYGVRTEVAARVRPPLTAGLAAVPVAGTLDRTADLEAPLRHRIQQPSDASWWRDIHPARMPEPAGRLHAEQGSCHHGPRQPLPGGHSLVPEAAQPANAMTSIKKKYRVRICKMLWTLEKATTVEVTPAAQDLTRQSRDGLRTEQREAHESFERGNELRQVVVKRHQPIFGHVDPIARQYLVVGGRCRRIG